MSRELLVARILAGHVRLRFGGRCLLLQQPTAEQRYVAQELYQHCLAEALADGAMSDRDLLEHLLDIGEWDDARASLLARLPEELEELKVQLYKATFESNKRRALRAAIAVNRERTLELQGARHAFDHLSASGIASLARDRYLFGCALRRPDGAPVFSDDEAFWQDDSPLLDQAMAAHAAVRISEAQYRDLARNEPWRSIWACRRAEHGVLGMPSANYTEEQRVLVSYSLLYDSVYEHPDCPGDDILADDDLLDGWLILQRRQRKDRAASKLGEDRALPDADEVYIPADTTEDARRVHALNDAGGTNIVRQRFEHIRRHGEVEDKDLPDVRQARRMAAAQVMR
jgi:hypothetical protein